MENITMFIIGLIIFCAYVITLFTIIIKSNNAQQKDLDNDPELRGKSWFNPLYLYYYEKINNYSFFNKQFYDSSK